MNVHRPFVSRGVGMARADVSRLQVLELRRDVQSIRGGRHGEDDFDAAKCEVSIGD
jgi:hypothetical protein